MPLAGPALVVDLACAAAVLGSRGIALVDDAALRGLQLRAELGDAAAGLLDAQ